MAFPQKTTREQKDEIVGRVLAGETQISLAREFGVTRSYISFLAKKARGGVGKAHLTETDYETIRERKAAG